MGIPLYPCNRKSPTDETEYPFCRKRSVAPADTFTEYVVCHQALLFVSGGRGGKKLIS